ncbi:vWA domain-containing protein [Parenemella sanctibonifatiensis]|uniref:VWFA domain-containing protein n=1 Tax=Parenemella sanctibonifatiensis TaxID=2016505 RepID=A0A255E929_9ACTN|nr:VWA domain-containing protein [Parenemella sanctibonifatiensis]OYN84633.1 hypothetical protein CGZ92_12430 [Parenemella sanctibonifatiensis]
MALSFWWLAIPLALAIAGAGIWWWRRTPEAPAAPREGMAAANLERVRSLPRYRHRVQGAMRWSLIQLVCLVVAASGALLLTGRLSAVSSESPELRNRDVLLCLDVSDSMDEVLIPMLESYVELAQQLEGERIGLMIWSSTSLLKFPLTTDTAFIVEELNRGKTAIEDFDVTWTTGTLEGTGEGSLVGDGLMSCLDHFGPVTDPPRSRSVVFATDNETGDTSIFSLPEATDVAVERGVMIYGLAPEVRYGKEGEYSELHEQAQRTGGNAWAVDDGTSVTEIVDAIEQTEASKLEGPEQILTTDLPWIGFVLVSVGLIGATVAQWQRGRQA